MKIAVVYARYSSTNQTEQSIEGQMHVCEDYARRHDILIVDSYIDRAISGTTDNRESFQKMLKDSNNKKWDYVLVYKLDRFARNKFESAIHRKHLKDNGIKLLSAMENIPETPEGVLLESLLEGMNQYFSEELAQKVSRGLHESRMKGHCIGSVPYGYIKENKKLIINQEESEILNRIFNDYNSGKTILQISRDLQKECITNNGKRNVRNLSSLEEEKTISNHSKLD
jgi:DNA invertase Pin-like site-specific DNA recombinase